VIGRLVYIGEIVHHHCLNFLFITERKIVNRMSILLAVQYPAQNNKIWKRKIYLFQNMTYYLLLRLAKYD